MSSLSAILPLLSKFSKIPTWILPGLSKATLYSLALIVLVNINSFPFIWHCRSSQSPRVCWLLRHFTNTDKIFRHIWIIKIRFMFYKLMLIGKSREAKKELESAWLEKLIPIGSGASLF
jgi:hypothetical protein